MTILTILLLIFLGIVLLLLEFAVIPGITIAGIGGMVLFGYSIYLAFDTYGTGVGIGTLLFIIIVVPILMYKVLKGKLGEKMSLKSTIIGKTNLIEDTRYHVGDLGVTVTRLGPIGKVEFDGQIMEGKSTGPMMDAGTEVEIVKILKNQIIVKPVKKEEL
jgi:membrane-bound ClpP family serine protease